MQLKSYSLLKILFLCLVGRRFTISQASDDAESSSQQSSSYFFYQQPEYPRDCKELTKHCTSQNDSQVHLIRPDGYLDPFLVYCENEWTVILRRENGFVNFRRDSTEYDNGFGFLNVDFWLGNEKLAYLTNQKQYELMINFETKTGDSFFITYNFFRIGDNFNNYTLVSVGDYTGTIESFIEWCPSNMAYGNCRCQGTCANPTGNCDCSLVDRVCFCPDEFLMHEDKCIIRDSCGCYLEGVGVIPEGEVYVDSNCTQRCDCQDGILTCTALECDSNAICTEDNGARNCTCNQGYEGDGQSCSRLPRDCFDLQIDGNTASGDYTINPAGWTEGPFDINCNMTIDGGGWTVFQRRIDGTQPFDLVWDRYKEGFGTLTGEFWMGNDKLAFITNQRDYELRIDLNNYQYQPYYAKYDLFRIADERNKYRMVGLGNYTGTAGYDSLRYHHYQAFSTIDEDNDVDVDGECAVSYRSAWWYNRCYYSDLNRKFTGSTIYWNYLHGSDSNIKYVEMKIRPRQ